jgi:cysteine desulfurase
VQPRIYLDWNATTPPLPDVVRAMAEAAASKWGNPASPHGVGRAARDVVESARESVADLLGFDARDVIFTAGGTEANNLALRSARALVTSRLEHPSVTAVAEALETEGVAVAWLPVPASGLLDPAAIARALRGLPEGATVAVAAANHETGVVQDLAAIASVVGAAAARLHVDAVQAVAAMDAGAFRDADTVSIAAHKLRGPKGIGALAHRPGRPPRPLLLGGAQERGRRPGTQDAALAAGFRVAADWAKSERARRAPLAALRDSFEEAFVGCGAAVVNGDHTRRLEHVTNLSFRGCSGDELVAALDLEGVAVSSGAACSAGTTEPSKVISAMLGPERARSALRVSLGSTTTAEEVAQALQVLRRLLRV